MKKHKKLYARLLAGVLAFVLGAGLFADTGMGSVYAAEASYGGFTFTASNHKAGVATLTEDGNYWYFYPWVTSMSGSGVFSGYIEMTISGCSANVITSGALEFVERSSGPDICSKFEPSSDSSAGVLKVKCTFENQTVDDIVKYFGYLDDKSGSAEPGRLVLKSNLETNEMGVEGGRYSEVLNALLNINVSVTMGSDAAPTNPKVTYQLAPPAATGTEAPLTGTGTVTVGGQTVALNGSVEVTPGDVEFVFAPTDGSYVTGYTIGDELVKQDSIPGAKDDLTKRIITVIRNVTADTVITVQFTKNEPKPQPETNRPQGNLKWNTDIPEKSNITYKQALEMTYTNSATSYNAAVRDYILNSYFGTSWTYGEDLLADPKMYFIATFNGGTPIKVGEEGTPQSLGKVGGMKPTQGMQLAATIQPADVVPGPFSQTVEADYYTASGICGNHWYHVGGVAYHEDGMSRNFTIDKDELVMPDLKDTYPSNAIPKLEEIKAMIKPVTKDMVGSKATLDPDQLEVKIIGPDGKEVTGDNYTMVGDYKVVVTYPGSDYIGGYADTELGTFTVEKSKAPAAVEPTIKQDNGSVTLEGLQDDQVYCIEVEGAEGGETWMTKAELEEALKGGLLTNLPKDAKYTVKTKIPGSDLFEEGDTAETTYVRMSGTVTSQDAAYLPAVVTFTGSDGTTYTTVTDANGNYSIDLPEGTGYSVKVTYTDEDGKVLAESDEMTGIDVPGADGSREIGEQEMKMTGAGLDDFIRKYVTGTDDETYKMATRTNYAQILGGKSVWEKLTQDQQDAINAILTGEPNNGKSYEDLLAEAQKIDAQIKAENNRPNNSGNDEEESSAAPQPAAAKDKDVADRVKTGDDGGVLALLFVMALAGAAVVYFIKKEKTSDNQ